MLQNATVTTVLPVNNLEACSTFYQQKLGMKSKSTLPGGEVLLSCNGSDIMLRPVKDATPTGMTEVSFSVRDIGKEISDLESKGVKFEDYSEPEFKTDSKHIHQDGNLKSAWFKDPSGNVLCLHEFRA